MEYRGATGAEGGGVRAGGRGGVGGGGGSCPTSPPGPLYSLYIPYIFPEYFPYISLVCFLIYGINRRQVLIAKSHLDRLMLKRGPPPVPALLIN